MPRKGEGKRNPNGAGSIRKITVHKNGKDYISWQARYTVGYDPGTGKQIQITISPLKFHHLPRGVIGCY